MSDFGSERAARQNAVGSKCPRGPVDEEAAQEARAEALRRKDDPLAAVASLPRPHAFALDPGADCWTCAACGEQRTLEGPDRKLPKLRRDAEERAAELEALTKLEPKVAAAKAGQAIEEEEAEETPRQSRRDGRRR